MTFNFTFAFHSAASAVFSAWHTDSRWCSTFVWEYWRRQSQGEFPTTLPYPKYPLLPQILWTASVLQSLTGPVGVTVQSYGAERFEIHFVWYITLYVSSVRSYQKVSRLSLEEKNYILTTTSLSWIIPFKIHLSRCCQMIHHFCEFRKHFQTFC